MKKGILVSLLSAVLMSGCMNRESLYDLASIHSSEVPSIIVSDPADGLADVPVDALIGMLFSRPMDRSSVEQSFRFSCSGQTYYASNGTFHWDTSGRLAVFEPDPPFEFPGNAGVTVRMDPAQATDGLRMRHGFEWRFTTGAAADPGTLFNITGAGGSYTTLPLGLQKTDTRISIDFDKKMLRSTVEGSFLLMSSDFQDVRTFDHGHFEWSEPTAGTERATFVPAEQLMPNKTYMVYLNGNGISARDIAGNTLNPGSPLSPPFSLETIDNAIYVSASGNNMNEGFHRSVPVQDMATGIIRALAYGFTHLKVAQGTYIENLVFDNPTFNNFRVQAGWNADFSAYDPDPLMFPATVQAAASGYTLTLSGVTGFTLQGIAIQGPDTAVPDINGALLINAGGSGILIDRCALTGSNAAEEGRGMRITGGSRNIEIRSSYIFGSNNTGTNHGCGISIEGARAIHIHDNRDIEGGGAAMSNTAIDIYGSSSDVLIEKNEKITGGWEGKPHGILIGADAQNITVQKNLYIEGAIATGAGPAFAVYMSGNASALIQDNQEINGGQTFDRDTYGLWVENGAVANIYRNTIIGGEDIGVGAPNVHAGIMLSGSGNCNVFNNFVLGGRSTTDPSNSCYGIFILNSDADIVNNTIDGQGAPGAVLTAALYGKTTRSNVINNILMGGEGVLQHGIVLSELNSSINDLLIYYNAFGKDMCQTSYLRGEVPAQDLKTINDLETLYNPGRRPAGNNEYNALPPLDDGSYGEVEFIDSFNALFIVDFMNSTNPWKIADNGYNLSTLLSPAELQQARFDWFYVERSVTSTDLGAHEIIPR